MGIRATLDIACRSEEQLDTIKLIINSIEDACVYSDYMTSNDALEGEE